MNLLHTDPGFRPAQAVALQLSIPAHRYGKYETGGKNQSRQQLYDHLERAVQSLASVEAVGVTAKLPLRQFWDPGAISIEGRPPVPRLDSSAAFNKHWGLAMQGDVSTQRVSPGYLAALGIPLLRGRKFENGERPDAPMTAVINEALVRKFFPNEDPIGKRITIDMTSYAPRMIIVGIVADSRFDGMDQAALPEVFWPMAQLPSSNVWLVARSRADADAVGTAVRQVVHDVDPEIAVPEMQTMTNVLEDSLWRERFSALLIGLFAVLAALIAAVGLYAVIAYTVERRTRDLGVRVALGAGGINIAQTVLGHGLRVTAMGTTIGAGLAVAANRVFSHQISDTKDLPLILVTVSLAQFLVAVLACSVPLRKALTVDPLDALRSD